MPRRRRITGKKTPDAAVSREEFEQLKGSLDDLLKQLSRGMDIRAVLGDGGDLDDSYEIFFNGPALRADTVETITDGEAPASSPVPSVRGSIQWLHVEWEGVANADNVTYEVHVSTTTDFTPDSTTLYGEMSGTVMAIKTLPDGTALAYGTDYYVKIVAKDGDGAAAASAQGTAQLTQVTGPDIAVDSITAAKILAGEVGAAELAAEIVLSSLFKTAASGRRIEFDSDSFRMIDSDDVTKIVDMPTDGSDIDIQAHIRALGVDLLADSSGSVPDDRKLRYLSDIDDSVIGQVYAQEVHSGVDLRSIYMRSEAPADENVSLGLFAEKDDGVYDAFFDLKVDSSGYPVIEMGVDSPGGNYDLALFGVEGSSGKPYSSFLMVGDYGTENWRIERYTPVADPGSVAAGARTTFTFSGQTGVEIGDIVIFCGVDPIALDVGDFIMNALSPANTTGQLQLRVKNTSSVARDLGSTAFDFLVIHTQ